MGQNKDTLVHDEFDILQPEAGKKVSDKTIIDIEKYVEFKLADKNGYGDWDSEMLCLWVKRCT